MPSNTYSVISIILPELGNINILKINIMKIIKIACKKSSASLYIINSDFFLSLELCCLILLSGWWTWLCRGHWCFLFWLSWYFHTASLDKENLQLILCYGNFGWRTRVLPIMIEDDIKSSLKQEWICHLVLLCFDS